MVAILEIQSKYICRFMVFNFFGGGGRLDPMYYSLVHLVVPKLEEIIYRTLLDLFKIRLLFQDRVRSQNVRINGSAQPITFCFKHILTYFAVYKGENWTNIFTNSYGHAGRGFRILVSNYLTALRCWQS